MNIILDKSKENTLFVLTETFSFDLAFLRNENGSKFLFSFYFFHKTDQSFNKEVN